MLFRSMIAGCCIPFTYVYFKAGQSGCKLQPELLGKTGASNVVMKELQGKERVVKDSRGDDKYWKLGLFYYNENDPAMLVEDRFGTNSSFNYARLASKIVTALLIIMTAAVYIGTTIMFIKS